MSWVYTVDCNTVPPPTLSAPSSAIQTHSHFQTTLYLHGHCACVYRSACSFELLVWYATQPSCCGSNSFCGKEPAASRYTSRCALFLQSGVEITLLRYCRRIQTSAGRERGARAAAVVKCSSTVKTSPVALRRHHGRIYRRRPVVTRRRIRFLPVTRHVFPKWPANSTRSWPLCPPMPAFQALPSRHRPCSRSHSWSSKKRPRTSARSRPRRPSRPMRVTAARHHCARVSSYRWTRVPIRSRTDRRMSEIWHDLRH